MHLDKLRKISRERFWTYTVWPYLLWIAATWVLRDIKSLWVFTVPWILLLALLLRYCCYFMFPVNLLIYWVNDIADWDTDEFNDKKWTYEVKLQWSHHKSLSKNIIIRNTLPHVVWLILWVTVSISSPEVIIAFLAFYFTSIFYSLPPIRAKARPFIDWAFNILYAIPWLIGFLLLWGTASEINRAAFLAWWLWCIAMHTYSAIPDIEPDTKANIQTTATTLWEKRTLIYCLILRVLSAILFSLWSPSLVRFGLISLIIYVILICASFIRPVFKIYKFFPRINWVLWFILFWIITAQLYL